VLIFNSWARLQSICHLSIDANVLGRVDLFLTGENTMQISGNFSISGIDAARGATRTNAIKAAHEEATASLAMPVDQLELSPEALGIGETNSSSEVFRADKVAALRDAIASGDYDTDEKLNAAFEIMLDRLG
jgi:negative regulator of flagellin synthesis FlgM